MSKFNRYEAVQNFVGKAAEQAQQEWLDQLGRQPKLNKVKKIRDQYLDLMRQPGTYLYSWNRWAQHELGESDIYYKGKWFITNSAGKRHEVPWRTAKKWINDDILFRNAHGWALKENIPVFDDEITEAINEAIKGRKARKQYR